MAGVQESQDVMHFSNGDRRCAWCGDRFTVDVEATGRPRHCSEECEDWGDKYNRNMAGTRVVGDVVRCKKNCVVCGKKFPPKASPRADGSWAEGNCCSNHCRLYLFDSMQMMDKACDRWLEEHGEKVDKFNGRVPQGGDVYGSWKNDQAAREWAEKEDKDGTGKA